jgi:hypothetical protein
MGGMDCPTFKSLVGLSYNHIDWGFVEDMFD